MSVKLHGSIADKEYYWGVKLRDELENDPQLISHENEVHIFPSVQCYHQNPQDIDLVVLGNLKNYSTTAKFQAHGFDEFEEERTVIIKNFCIVIEVKKHGIDGIKFEGSHLKVNHGGKYFSASDQNDAQIYSLRRFFNNKGAQQPFVGNIIYLPSISKKQIPTENDIMNIIFSDFTISDFWTQSLRRFKNKGNDSEIVCQSMHQNLFENELSKYLKILDNRMEFSRLDRLKIEAICKKEITDQKYKDEFGEKLLIFRGRGGTGKTYRLLNIAKYLYDSYDARILLLTYNKALISDIMRLFAILRIPPDSIDGSIIVKTIHSFFYGVFYKMELSDEFEEDSNYDNFSNYKERLNSLLDKTVKKNRLSELSTKYPDLFKYDYVMIDEGQDWPSDERDIIYKLFGSNNIIIADGIDQLIRGNKPCKWKNSSLCTDSKTISLHKGFRQKTNLTKFIKEFASKLNSEWNVEDSEEKYGGKIIIVEGNYSFEIHKKLIEQNISDKNENVDMLFCVPPKYKSIEKNDNRDLSLSEAFIKWDFPVWNGVDVNFRGTYPTSLKQLRIVQYDSCRGLEGWICVNVAFDKFYDYKYETYKSEKKGQMDFMSDEVKKELFVANWCLIPLTRAMDTIVLHIEDSNSYISKILKDIYNDGHDYIEWISN